MNNPKLGPCAKAQVKCILTFPDGRTVEGENLCENPQEACPRLPGEGHEKCLSVCRQIGHAETTALDKCGGGAVGATARVYGHSYVCRDCQEALYAAGVVGVSATIESAKFVWRPLDIVAGTIVGVAGDSSRWMLGRAYSAWHMVELRRGTITTPRSEEELIFILNEGGWRKRED